jgi:hypothetical protein
MADQVTIIRLEEALAREMRARVAAPHSGYRSVDEFVEVAIRNQLVLQNEPAAQERDGERRIPFGVRPLLAQPRDNRILAFAAPRECGVTISALTNRLSPLKIALRVACNLASESEWPTIRSFHQTAAQCARLVGMNLRAEEERFGTKGTERRSTAYPCGEDERKSLDRFIAHFTTAKRPGSAPGPLEILGLVALEDERLQLSADGWALGVEASPLLGECEGSTLSEAERRLFLRRIAASPGEEHAIREVLRIIKRAAGNQQRVDELVSLAHTDWTPTLAVSHRAAIVGRTRELGLVDQKGRGVEAKLLLTVAGESWLKERSAKEPA